MAMNAAAKTYLEGRITALSAQLAGNILTFPDQHNQRQRVEIIQQIGHLQQALATPSSSEGDSGAGIDYEFVISSYRVVTANPTAGTTEGDVLEHRLLINVEDGSQISSLWYNVTNDPSTALTTTQEAALDVPNDLESTGTSTSSSAGGIQVAEVTGLVETRNSLGDFAGIDLSAIESAVSYTVILNLSGYSTDVTVQLEGQMPGSSDWVPIANEKVLTKDGFETQIGELLVEDVRVKWISGTATSLSAQVYATGYANAASEPPSA